MLSRRGWGCPLVGCGSMRRVGMMWMRGWWIVACARRGRSPFSICTVPTFTSRHERSETLWGRRSRERSRVAVADGPEPVARTPARPSPLRRPRGPVGARTVQGSEREPAAGVPGWRSCCRAAMVDPMSVSAVRVGIRDGQVVHLKRCARCKETKVARDHPDSEFWVSNRNPDGSVKFWQGYCKACSKERRREYVEANRERVNEQRRKRHRERMETDPAYRERHRVASRAAHLRWMERD